MIKKIIYITLCSILGAVFIFSGYTKLYPIEPFEFTFVDLGFINWQIAPFIARIMIGFELIIGALLFINLNPNKWVYKLAVVTLIVFCIYLVLLMAFTGNKGNCGCFGTVISMTPLQALIKNIIMLAAFFVLNRYYEGWSLPRKYSTLIALPVIALMILPFILNPIQLDYSSAYLNKPEENFKIELDTLYKYATLNVPPNKLKEGKHIISFMSLTCPHCRIAANKIRIMHERNPQLPFYIVLNGDNENLKPFFDATHTEDISHCMLVGGNTTIGNYFVYVARRSELPAIYLVNNSVVEHSVDLLDMDEGEIEKWLSGSFSEK